MRHCSGSKNSECTSLPRPQVEDLLMFTNASFSRARAGGIHTWNDLHWPLESKNWSPLQPTYNPPLVAEHQVKEWGRQKEARELRGARWVSPQGQLHLPRPPCLPCLHTHSPDPGPRPPGECKESSFLLPLPVWSSLSARIFPPKRQ